MKTKAHGGFSVEDDRRLVLERTSVAVMLREGLDAPDTRYSYASFEYDMEVGHVKVTRESCRFDGSEESGESSVSVNYVVRYSVEGYKSEETKLWVNLTRNHKNNSAELRAHATGWVNVRMTEDNLQPREVDSALTLIMHAVRARLLQRMRCAHGSDDTQCIVATVALPAEPNHLL